MSKIAARIIVLETRIAADTLALAEAKLALAAESLSADVAAGYAVSFKVGRAETRRTVEGVVLGRGTVKDVDSVRVNVGEGLAAELYTIPVSQLLSISAPEKQPSAIAVALGTAAAGEPEVAGADADLLSEVIG